MASTTSQAMLNHHQQLGLYEEQEHHMSTQMGFFSYHPNNNNNNNNMALPSLPSSSSSHHQPLKTFTILPCDDHHQETLAATTTTTTNTNLKQQRQQQELMISSDLGGPQLLSLQRSSANLWAWEGVNECLTSNMKKSSGQYVDHHLGVSAMKMKKMKARRKVREPRFCFKTMSDVDVLDDGYKWRKYGQKVVKNTQHPRSYYRCTQDNCRVKKRVERLAEDPRMVITTYEGRHAHSPSHDLEGSQSPSHLNNFFW